MLLCALVALIGVASLQPVLSQDVESRAGTAADPTIGGNGGGGQSRNIHSQKHLSPHRMMHFGKRPMVEQAPVGEFDDLYLPQVIVGQQSAQQPLQLVEPALDGSQYSVFINPLTERLADLTPESREILRNKQFADLVHNLLLESKEQCKAAERQLQELRAKQTQRSTQDAVNLAFSRAPSSYRLMNLMQEQSSDANAEANAAAAAEGAKNKEQGEQVFGQQQQDDQKPESINVVSRSLPKSSLGMMNSREPFDFNKVHIASLLLGRRITEPPSSIASLGTYIKKAEPHKMTFMHFG